jgi:hypothetical protein
MNLVSAQRGYCRSTLELMLTGIEHSLDRMYWDQHELAVHILSFSDQG